MASTNKTEHYNLSQFVPLDKPAWLGDYNSDMQKIDAGIYAAQSKADSLGTEVEAASTAATAAQQAAQSATEAAQQASDKAQDAETTANGVSATASQALTTAQQAQTTATQAQSEVANALLKTGGTMLGSLILHANPTQNLEAATKQYVDQQTSGGSIQETLINAKPYAQWGTAITTSGYPEIKTFFIGSLLMGYTSFTTAGEVETNSGQSIFSCSSFPFPEWMKNTSYIGGGIAWEFGSGASGTVYPLNAQINFGSKVLTLAPSVTPIPSGKTITAFFWIFPKN